MRRSTVLWCVGAGLLLVLGPLDVFDIWPLERTETWKRDGITYTDRLKGDAHVHRRVEYPSGLIEWTEGPMSASGKPHGQWTIWWRDPKPGEPRIALRWYWYGERCTEAEWHRWANGGR